MKIYNVSVNEVIPYISNPRFNEKAVDKVASSIKEFGWQQPIVVDKDKVIIAGHTRYKAAQKLVLQEVPIVIADNLTPAQIKAYRIADNRVSQESEWDLDLLKVELEGLQELDFDLCLTGFNLDEIDGLLIDKTDGLTDENHIPDFSENPVSKPGDLWILGNHRIICGDSTYSDTVQRLLDGVKPHLMVTDPPYGVEYDPGWRNQAERANGKSMGTRATGKVLNDDKVDWRDAWALFPGDVAYVWHAGKFTGEVAESLKACDFDIRTQIIWAKSRFAISRGDYHYQHEPCWYAVRKKAKGHWNGDRSQTTLWQIPHNKCDTGHGTQKPVECMRKPIENNSNPGQAIYEPFSGSGTTIIAAEQTGRSCYAIELNPCYVDVAVKRWQDFTGKKAILDGDGRTFDDIQASTNCEKIVNHG